MGKRPGLSVRCAATLFIAAFLMAVDAAEIRRRDGIHRVSKTPPQVTPGPRLDRRAAITACPASYSLCPDNLGGGCCQGGYTCATESCFATTEGPATCNGRTGYFACGADVGGGCCPVGSVCERGGQCVAVSGVSYSHDCSANSYLCPAELGYGCCRDGLACGTNQCYATEPLTYTFTKTVTTTDGDDKKTLTSTVTTTSTPAVDSEPTGALPSQTEFMKYFPSAVAKVDPLITETDGGGLSGAQIGGAVGGAIALLAIILVAAFFIIKRLNHVAKVVNEGPSSTGPGSQADAGDYFKGTDAELESVNTDMMSISSPHTRHRSASTTTSEPAASLFGLQSTPGGSGFSSRRHSHRSSADSTGRSTPGTPSTWTRSNSTARSSAGGASGSVDGGMSSETEPDEIAELETDERIVELPADPVVRKPGPEAAGARTASPGRGFQKGAVGRGDGLAPPPQQGHKRNNSAAGRGAPQLDVVSEAGEIHGYYGPVDKLTGQTATTATMTTTMTTTTTTTTTTPTPNTLT